MFKKVKHLHFVGIGGVSMSGIAEVIHNLGFEVSGSDIADSPTIKRLKEMGIKVFIGHKADNINGADVVVYTAAAPITNPEIMEAKRRKIPVIPRAEMLNELMRFKTGIAIAGTHGKTTTTSMTGKILADSGLDPTILVGGRLKAIGSNAVLGKGEYIVFEACEAFGSFLYFSPIMLVVTNIDRDHLEYYKNMDSLKEAFLNFINGIPFYGLAILNADDNNLFSILDDVNKRYILYSIKDSPDAAVKAYSIGFDGSTSYFNYIYNDKDYGRVVLPLPGLHNVSNALAAITIAIELDIDFEKIKSALASFENAQRRFEIHYNDEVMVVDDYAHHPAEIKATLEAARQLKMKRVIAIFQPHLYSRTQLLYKEFAKSLAIADVVYLTDIYGAREKPFPGVSSKLIVDVLDDIGFENIYYIKNKDDIPEFLSKDIKAGDIILTLGAGDIYKIIPSIISQIGKH